MATKSQENEIAKLKKLLEQARLENKAIRDTYKDEQECNQKAYEENLKIAYNQGYQQALEDIAKARKDFAKEVDKANQNTEL